MRGFAIVTLFLFAGQCFGWGEEGHKIVAQIASDRLSTFSQKYVAQFLSGSDYSSIVDIAPLPDDYDHSPAGRWSGPCHYCNLPRGATQFEMSMCGSCCVVGAINNYTQILGTELNNFQGCQFGYGVEPCAMEFLVHFVGDIHQPLHVGYAYDEGGNTVKVDFFGKQTELHATWDTWIIEKWDKDYQDAATQLESMMAANPTQVAQLAAVTDPLQWADESFDFVRTVVYNFTSNSNGVGQLG